MRRAEFTPAPRGPGFAKRPVHRGSAAVRLDAGSSCLVLGEIGYYPRLAVKPFLDDDFLLPNETAVRLYHEHAKGEPIIDYHCHLPPDQIANNHRFGSLTEIWLNGDHYKWRALRANGVPERLDHRRRVGLGEVRGLGQDGALHPAQPALPLDPPRAAVPLRRQGQAAQREDGPRDLRPLQRLLEQDDFTTQGLLRQYKVLVVCSTDDPTDSLEHHAKHAKQIKASTAGDPPLSDLAARTRSLAVHDLPVWNEWVGKLEAASGRGGQELRRP